MSTRSQIDRRDIEKRKTGQDKKNYLVSMIYSASNKRSGFHLGFSLPPTECSRLQIVLT